MQASPQVTALTSKKEEGQVPLVAPTDHHYKEIDPGIGAIFTKLAGRLPTTLYLVRDESDAWLWERPIAEMKKLLEGCGAFTQVHVLSLSSQRGLHGESQALELLRSSGEKQALVIVLTDLIDTKLWRGAGPVCVRELAERQHAVIMHWLPLPNWGFTEVGWCARQGLSSNGESVVRSPRRRNSSTPSVDGPPIAITDITPESCAQWGDAIFPGPNQKQVFSVGLRFPARSPEEAVSASNIDPTPKDTEYCRDRRQLTNVLAGYMGSRLLCMVASVPAFTLEIAEAFRSHIVAHEIGSVSTRQELTALQTVMLSGLVESLARDSDHIAHAVIEPAVSTILDITDRFSVRLTSLCLAVDTLGIHVGDRPLGLELRRIGSQTTFTASSQEKVKFSPDTPLEVLQLVARPLLSDIADFLGRTIAHGRTDSSFQTLVELLKEAATSGA